MVVLLYFRLSFYLFLFIVASQLLTAPNRMLVTFDTRAQSFVFDTMFQFIKEKLASVPNLKVIIIKFPLKYFVLNYFSKGLDKTSNYVACRNRNAKF